MSVSVHPAALVDPGAVLGADVTIGAWCVVGAGVTLGDGVQLHNNVTVQGPCTLGAGCVVHPYAVLGGAPQDKSYKGEPTRLVVGPRNVIREHVTMNRGTAYGRGVTTVGADGYFMTAAHVAHDCVVGDGVVFANNATLGGHAEIGDFVIMGGLSAVHQKTRVGRHAFIGGLAAVVGDVIPYGIVRGVQAHLDGLNLTGLKRRGFTRDQIRDLRAAYDLLFVEDAQQTFQERLNEVAAQFDHVAEAMEIVAFLRADSARPLCLPRN